MPIFITYLQQAPVKITWANQDPEEMPLHNLVGILHLHEVDIMEVSTSIGGPITLVSKAIAILAKRFDSKRDFALELMKDTTKAQTKEIKLFKIKISSETLTSSSYITTIVFKDYKKEMMEKFKEHYSL
ncbi:hypothetical protein L1987_12967 [Smallanthus sonchifolius]|uniref:Uncharacterized protein n=1 Tax=Smallanthus sonchifolius TaxID=185202 RepID=A0ACB9JF70_9ASTR|nr:hypothetical protein L1987_12967 [Smallanthus sonchifolius]